MSIKSGKTFSEFNFSTYPHFFASARAQKICGFFYNPVFTVSGSFPPVSADTFSFGKMSAFDLSTFSTLSTFCLNFSFRPVFAILSISFVNPLCYNRVSFENRKSGDDI